jgi:cytidylate kinase
MPIEAAITPHPAITISRTFGSGGTEVGFLVARQLGWRFCDRSILRQTAQTLGLSSASLRYQEERRCGFLDRLLSLIAITSPEVPFIPPLDMPIYSRELFEVERNVMRCLVNNAPAVLVGRGGFVALKDRPATLHVRIQADLPFRMQFLVDRGKAADLESARKAIELSDRNRAAFIREVSGLDWFDPRLFDLVLDTSRDGIEACSVRLVEEAMARFH